MAVQFDKDKGFTGWWTLFQKELPKISTEINEMFDSINFRLATPKFWDDEDFDPFFDQFKIKPEDREQLKLFMKDYDQLGDASGKFQQHMVKNGKGVSAFSTAMKSAGNVLKSFGAALGSMAVNWLIGEALNFVLTYNQRLEEARQETIALGEETAETNKSVADLVEQYKKLGEDGKIDTSEQETARTIQEQ